MSTSAVSSSSLNQDFQSYFQTRNTDVQQLGQALQSGNLRSAQVAFNNITALGEGGPFASGNAFRGPARQQDFNAIGQALQSGDLAGAQSAFAALKSTVNQGGVTARPVGPATPFPISSLGSGSNSASGTGPEIVLNLSSAASGGSSSSGGTTNPEQITINIGQASGGAEQVSISAGNRGSNAEQITFNLDPNSNEQIILNLLGTTGSTGTSSTLSTAANSSSASSGLSVSA
jgi:hypothetical protein